MRPRAAPTAGGMAPKGSSSMQDERTPRVYQAAVQGDDGDELWLIDAREAETREDARRIGRELLAANATDGVRLTVFVYEGVMVNAGDETDPDWIFEADTNVDSEVIHP